MLHLNNNINPPQSPTAHTLQNPSEEQHWEQPLNGPSRVARYKEQFNLSLTPWRKVGKPEPLLIVRAQGARRVRLSREYLSTEESERDNGGSYK